MTDKKGLNEEQLNNVSGGEQNLALVQMDLEYQSYYNAYCKYCNKTHSLKYIGVRGGWTSWGTFRSGCKIFYCEDKQADNYYDTNGNLL